TAVMASVSSEFTGVSHGCPQQSAGRSPAFPQRHPPARLTPARVLPSLGGDESPGAGPSHYRGRGTIGPRGPLERAAPGPARGLGTCPGNAGSNAGRESAAMAPDLFEIRCPGQLSDRRASILPMRPTLKPGLLPVWRNRDTVQIGIDPRRAVALTGMRG